MNDLLSSKNDFLDISKRVDLKQSLALGLFYAIVVIIVFDFGTFLNRVFEYDMLEKVRLSRPNSFRVVEVVSNNTFFVNKLTGHPIGCGINLLDFMVNNTGLNALQKNTKTRKL